MRIAYICADPDILVFGTKGASAHIQDVIRELVRRDRDAEIHAVRMGDRVPADLADVPTVECPLDADGAGDRERAQAQVSRAVAQRVAKSAPDLVWERYSLFSTALASLARGSDVREILEANASLIKEQHRHRRLDDEAGARSALVEQSGMARAIICMSDPVCAWVEEMTDMEHTHTAPSGVDTNRITPVTEGAGRVVVTFVGTLKPWHGVEYLVGARVLTSSPWDLRITGSGPQRKALEEAARAAGVDVDFRGAAAPHEVPSHLGGSAIAVALYPAPVDEADHYFSPLKVYEYMVADLPVVAGALGQIPMALLGYGVLVPPPDTAVLARAIDALTQDPEHRTELGAQTRLTTEERYSWEDVVGRVLELVEV